MGRGRAKAKQTKVARELKYSTHGTDFEALQRELASAKGNGSAPASSTVPDDDAVEGVDGADDAASDYDGWPTDRR